MNNHKDYGSDSDSSDEDFRPDERTEKPLSEESSDDIDDDEEDLEDDDGAPKTKRSKRSGKPKNKKSNSTKKAVETMRTTRHSTEAGSAMGKTSNEDKEEIESDDEQKARADALWADFLGDVKQSTSHDVKKTEEKPKTIIVTTNGEAAKVEGIEKTSSDLDGGTRQKVTITEILDFAGEEVRVQKTVSNDSVKENQTARNLNSPGVSTSERSPTAGNKRSAAPGRSSRGGGGGGGGLSSLVHEIGKKKKISVLEKTKLDWNTFKKDEGIEEQLQTFNKGKDGFLERQDFLERTDLRQFEIERNLRQTRRKH